MNIANDTSVRINNLALSKFVAVPRLNPLALPERAVRLLDLSIVGLVACNEIAHFVKAAPWLAPAVPPTTLAIIANVTFDRPALHFSPRFS
jgi:hypothetical protein